MKPPSVFTKILPLLCAVASFSAAARAQPAPSTPAAASSPAPATAALPTIFVCADSTAKNNAGGAQGWGTAIEPYFDSTKATVNNVAHAGTSSRTYYNNPGDWPSVLPKIKSGDYVLLVFGINDGGPPRTERDRGSIPGIGDETVDLPKADGTTETAHTYGWYMSKMSTDALAKGAHVYLLTVTARDIWSNPKATFRDATITDQQDGYDPKDDRIERGTANGKYTQWTKDLGVKLHLPVLDLTNLEADRLEKMGRVAAMVNYVDHNHTKPAGADIVASTIISGLKAFKNSPFPVLLSAKGQAVPAADAKYVADNPSSDKPAK